VSEVDLQDALTEIAGRAPVPPVDLLERVETRHRRQRRRNSLTAAFCAVLVVAAGGWLISRPSAEDNVPTAFQLPPIPAQPPLITETWPAATVTGTLPRPPDGEDPIAMDRIDQHHLLVWSRVARGSRATTSTLWNYSVPDRTYRPVLTNLPARAVQATLSVGDDLLVRVERTGDDSRVFVSPVAGGSTALHATLYGIGVTGVYTDGRSVYWSTNTPHAVMRAAEGTQQTTMTAFQGLTIDGTPWARNDDATLFRNLVTGEERRVVRPAGADKLSCVPAFCLGHDPAGWFLQRTDGTERTARPYPGTPQLVGGFSSASGEPADSGLLLLEHGVLLDPVRGKLGVAGRRGQCDVVTTSRGGDLIYGWKEQVGGECSGSYSTAYIGSTD
jgi:hypothetical protein